MDWTWWGCSAWYSTWLWKETKCYFGKMFVWVSLRIHLLWLSFWHVQFLTWISPIATFLWSSSLTLLSVCLFTMFVYHFFYDRCSYDAEAFFFDEGVRTSKREQLESKLLQAMPLFAFVIFQLEKIPHELFHINI